MIVSAVCTFEKMYNTTILSSHYSVMQINHVETNKVEAYISGMRIFLFLEDLPFFPFFDQNLLK